MIFIHFACFGRFSIDATEETIKKCFFSEDESSYLVLKSMNFLPSNEYLDSFHWIDIKKQSLPIRIRYFEYSKSSLPLEVDFSTYLKEDYFQYFL